MRRFLMCAAVIAVAWAGTLTHAQTAMKITSVDDYAKAMKAIGAGFGGANKAIQSGALADAKMGVAAAKAQMMAVQAFWVEKKKDDPAMIAKQAVEKMEALEKALGGSDQAAVMAAVKEVGGACGACHTKYRDQDPTTKAYSFKPGVL